LILGQNIIAPLTIATGLEEEEKEKFATSVWIEELCDCLEALRDVAVEREGR